MSIIVVIIWFKNMNLVVRFDIVSCGKRVWGWNGIVMID